ncbi:MAG: cytochrome c [Chromatiaceae bacterium]|nr:cytochrome c [Gammaproteobacteria bacterium]MCP5300526.1 cytochrome c [Chromatiaceae bacterium]MCP5422598.1 cytochrome c [Chromatiaceae bacterium]
MAALVLLFGAVHAAQGADRWFEPRHAAAGRPLFVQHCAACHGQRGEGAPDWRRRLEDGSFPPPPLNGTGHAWHHPLAALYATIATGQGRMPAWSSLLGRGEILAIIAWFQSQWPDEIYAAWARMDRAER